MTTSTFYIWNTKTDESFDTIEGKFYGPNWSPELSEKNELEILIANDPTKFENCLIINKVEMPTRYVICDETANTGKPYISEDLSNTGDYDSAWQFDNKKDAQKVIDDNNWEWAYIEEI